MTGTSSQTAAPSPTQVTAAQRPPSARTAATRKLAGFDRFDAVLFALIVLLALVLRLIYVFQLRSSPYFAHHVMDPRYHHDWAQAIAEGRRFWNGPYFRAPLYPWFLGLVYRLFGPDNPLAPRIIQAAIGSLSCGVVFALGRLMFSRTAGVLAGLMATSYWVFLYYDAELLIPVLIVLLDLVLLGLLWHAGRRPRWWLWLCCGLVMGLSAIARPNILLLAPPLVAWVFVLHRRQWKRALGHSLCLFVGTMTPIVPVTIRNYVVGHEFILIASQGGVNFYIGNNPDSDGMSAVIKGDPPQWKPCFDAQIARAERAAGHALSAGEVSDWYTRQALRFLRRQPGQAARLMLKKLRCFWSRWEVGNNQDLYFITSHYTPIVAYLPVRFAWFAPLGVLGVVLSLRRARELFPVWAFVVVYMLSVVMFFVNARYRVPVDAVLILLAGHALDWLAGTLRRRRWRSAIGGLTVVAVMGWVVSYVPPGLDRGQVQGLRAAAMLYWQQGDTTEAQRLLRESVRRAEETGWPVDPTTWSLLGSLSLKEGDLAEARRCLENALRIDPATPGARNTLGAILATQGHLEQAIHQFELLVQQEPTNAAAWANLGSAWARAGRIERAAQALRRATRLSDESRAVLRDTVRWLRAHGRAADAKRLLQTLGNGKHP